MASSHRLSALTGPPGSGKTLSLRALAQRFPNSAIIAVAARANQQAQDMTGCRQCWTIAQCTGDSLSGYEGDPDKLCGLDLLILEEASMISSGQLAEILEIAFSGGTIRVLLCGDGDQLGPIDAGCPFFDLMNSKMIPTTRLTKIYRQDPESHGIRELCLDVLAGEIKFRVCRR